MRHYLLNAAQKAANPGFTDCFVIPYTDLTEGTDNTAESVTLDGLVLGDVVQQNVLVDITAAWNGDAALTGTVSVGVVGDTTALTPALTIATAGTGTAVGNGNQSASQTDAAYRASTGVNLVAEFTPDSDSANDEYTAGEIRIYMNISRFASRAGTDL